MNSPKILMLIGAAFTLNVYASAGGSEPTRASPPTVETQTSPIAHVHADVQRADRAWQVYGEVHQPNHGMGTIPGHVDIELIAEDGTVLARTNNGYHHRSRRSRYSWFLVDLPEVDGSVAKIRVMHHGAGHPRTPSGV